MSIRMQATGHAPIWDIELAQRYMRPLKPPPDREYKYMGFDFDPPSEFFYKSRDKRDTLQYCLSQAPLFMAAGALAGLQDAYIEYEKAPDALRMQKGPRFRMFCRVFPPKVAYATLLGTLFCAADSLIEQYRGKRDYFGGMSAGAITGFAHGFYRCWPQPFVWPVVGAVLMAVNEFCNVTLQKQARERGDSQYRPPLHRETWGDPWPPHPLIMNTDPDIRPSWSGHYWRGI